MGCFWSGYISTLGEKSKPDLVHHRVVTFSVHQDSGPAQSSVRLDFYFLFFQVKWCLLHGDLLICWFLQIFSRVQMASPFSCDNNYWHDFPPSLWFIWSFLCPFYCSIYLRWHLIQNATHSLFSSFYTYYRRSTSLGHVNTFDGWDFNPFNELQGKWNHINYFDRSKVLDKITLHFLTHSRLSLPVCHLFVLNAHRRSTLLIYIYTRKFIADIVWTGLQLKHHTVVEVLILSLSPIDIYMTFSKVIDCFSPL